MASCSAHRAARGAIPVLEGSNSETVIVKLADLLSRYGIVPALLAGVILAGILASTMSTADSQLLAASSAISSDLLGSKFKKEQGLVVARITLLIMSVIGVILARDPNSSVFAIVSFAWAGFGASFGHVVLFYLFWKRTTKYGALAGMLTGGVMIFVWKYLVRPMGGILDIYELLPAFILASIVIAIVSLLTPEPEKEIIDEFNKAK